MPMEANQRVVPAILPPLTGQRRVQSGFTNVETVFSFDGDHDLGLG